MRRRRTLGLAPAEHATAVTANVEAAVTASEAAEGHAARGTCQEALRYALFAERGAAKADSHFISSKSRNVALRSSVERAARASRRAAEAVARACVRR